MSRFPTLTCNAINKVGDLHTNTNANKPNAVTWGVFPGREVVQPTIVELSSFDAWKDEAFALWEQWSRCYPAGSKPRDLLTEMGQTWYLVNIVDNDFHQPMGIFDIFEEELLADTASKAFEANGTVEDEKYQETTTEGKGMVAAVDTVQA